MDRLKHIQTNKERMKHIEAEPDRYRDQLKQRQKQLEWDTSIDTR